MSNVAFTLNAACYNPESWIHTLHGTKDPSIVSMTLNGQAGRITHPTVTTWTAHVILSPGTNTFYLIGIDNVSNNTETMTVSVVLPEKIPELHEAFNDVAKLSLPLGIKRLKGEKNIFLVRRASDAAYHAAGTHIQGSVEGISRSLGLTMYRDELSVYVNRTTYGDILSSTARIEITGSHVLVDADEIFRIDPHKVDPAWPGFYLDYEPRSASDVHIYADDNTEVSRDEYEVYPYDKRVVFNSEDYNNTWFWVKYNYRYSLTRAGNLASIKNFLESIDITNQQLFTVTVVSEDKNEVGLCQCVPSVVGDSDNPLTVNWCPIQVYSLHDDRFRDSMLNTYGAAYNTLLEAWAKTIAKKSKFGWEGVILDVDMWDPLYKRRNNAVLPHLSDSYRGHWKCADPTDENRYNYSDYVAYSGMCPNHPTHTLEYIGVMDNQWQSGVADDSALLVTGIDARS